MTKPVDDDASREVRRSRRKREVRAVTIPRRQILQRDLELGRVLYPKSDVYLRPLRRGECIGASRPCPYVACEHHLFLDVSPRTGAIKLNFPDLEPEDLVETCSLDVADRGGATLEDVGAMLNLTRERIRQIEVKALAKLEGLRALEEHMPEGRIVKKRALPIVNADCDEDDDDG